MIFLHERVVLGIVANQEPTKTLFHQVTSIHKTTLFNISELLSPAARRLMFRNHTI